MQEMRPIATDVARTVCLHVCLCVFVLGTRVSCAKTDEPIEMSFGADSYVGPLQGTMYSMGSRLDEIIRSREG